MLMLMVFSHLLTVLGKGKNLENNPSSKDTVFNHSKTLGYQVKYYPHGPRAHILSTSLPNECSPVSLMPGDPKQWGNLRTICNWHWYSKGVTNACGGELAGCQGHAVRNCLGLLYQYQQGKSPLRVKQHGEGHSTHLTEGLIMKMRF